MAKNDLVLVDSVFDSVKTDYGSKYNASECFELFCFEQILKDYDLSLEEVEAGWVDGGDDGGVDGFFPFVDGSLLTPELNPLNVRKQPEIEVVIITCKHASTFEQGPINNLVASLPELLDLSKDSTDITSTFNPDIIEIRSLFSEFYKKVAFKQPQLNIRVIYASRGDAFIRPVS